MADDELPRSELQELLKNSNESSPTNSLWFSDALSDPLPAAETINSDSHRYHTPPTHGSVRTSPPAN